MCCNSSQAPSRFCPRRAGRRIGGFRLDAVWIDIVRIVRVRAPQRVLPRRFHARKLGVVPVYLRLFLPVYAVERLL